MGTGMADRRAEKVFWKPTADVGGNPVVSLLPDQWHHSPMRRFFLIFLGIQILLFAVELLEPIQQHFILPWTALLARVCALLVTLFDSHAASVGKVLWNPATGFGVSIEPGCNGVEACIILLAAIIAFPASWRHRAWGLALGFVAVQGLNVVRVISLFYLGQWNETAFRVAHEYLWQGLIMIDVLVVWLVWVRTNPESWVGRPAPGDQSASA